MTQQFHSCVYIQWGKKTQNKNSFEKIHAPQRSLQHYVQWPRHGHNLNVHQQMKG